MPGIPKRKLKKQKPMRKGCLTQRPMIGRHTVFNALVISAKDGRMLVFENGKETTIYYSEHSRIYGFRGDELGLTPLGGTEIPYFMELIGERVHVIADVDDSIAFCLLLYRDTPPTISSFMECLKQIQHQ